jgi:hypothetical protein
MAGPNDSIDGATSIAVLACFVAPSPSHVPSPVHVTPSLFFSPSRESSAGYKKQYCSHRTSAYPSSAVCPRRRTPRHNFFLLASFHRNLQTSLNSGDVTPKIRRQFLPESRAKVKQQRVLPAKERWSFLVALGPGPRRPFPLGVAKLRQRTWIPRQAARSPRTT